MSVIIKMDMPQSCAACTLHEKVWCNVTHECDFAHEEMNEIGKHNCCPIIAELPDETGRLIAADEMKELVTKLKGFFFFFFRFPPEGVSRFEYGIDHLPTIVDAMKGR